MIFKFNKSLWLILYSQETEKQKYKKETILIKIQFM